MGMLSVEQLRDVGFSSVETNSRISDNASFYIFANGNNVRIDDTVLADCMYVAWFSLLVGVDQIRSYSKASVDYHPKCPFIVVVMITVAVR